MKKTLERIRRVIKKKSGVGAYAKEIGISSTTMFNFLNRQTEIQFDTLEKIIMPIGMDILESIPDDLQEVESVKLTGGLEGVVKGKGSTYEGGKIVLCFASTTTSYQGLIIKDNKGNHKLKIY